MCSSRSQPGLSCSQFRSRQDVFLQRAISDRKVPPNRRNNRIYIGREGREVGLSAISVSCRHQLITARLSESPLPYVTQRSHANVSSTYARRRRSHATSVVDYCKAEKQLPSLADLYTRPQPAHMKIYEKGEV